MATTYSPTPWTRPAWHDAGLCSQPESVPAVWDADWPAGHPRRHRATNMATALELCEGCPVQDHCAAEALAEDCMGTVRAGIPLTGQRLTRLQGNLLFDVAQGMPPRIAVEVHVGPLDAEPWSEAGDDA